MMSFYTGNEPGQVPGLLPDPYYWWEGGALMGALIDYWYYTGNDKWNDIAMQGLLFQVGPNRDYIPPNQTMTEGNDDQGFWGMAVLSAAEYNFPNPPLGQPQWLSLAQAVFNTQAARWDTAHCNGGLRWQIFQWNKGFDYKNSISQACFFNMAARLALYTGNEVYAKWANRIWEWMIGTGLMTQESYYIYDGAHINDNCTDITTYQWTYNVGAFLLGAAAMYNYTSDRSPAASEIWRQRVDGLLDGSQVFFIGAEKNIMAEVACESVHLCDNDQQSFKAYLARWMAATTKWAPWTYDTVSPLLEASSMAAAQQCTGGSNGRMCGLMWAGNNGKWDGSTGVGQQMAAMEAVLANLIRDSGPPVTNSTGGTSAGDPDDGAAGVSLAGANDDSVQGMRPITTADKAGGWLLTTVIIVFLV
ncbi:family 76 glycoside hydrolase, partial [Cryphonectria parasitica EP155]